MHQGFQKELSIAAVFNIDDKSFSENKITILEIFLNISVTLIFLKKENKLFSFLFS